MEINITNSQHTTATTLAISRPGQTIKNENDVTFIVKYPEDYKGPRNMPEGPTVTSKESAEIFSKRGIGHIQGAEQAQEPANEGAKNDGGESGSGESGGGEPGSSETGSQGTDGGNTAGINPQEMTLKELKAKLTELEISFASNAKQADLASLLTEALANTAGGTE